MKKAFIDRTPLRFIGGAFILIVGLLARSLSLSLLGVFDLIISLIFFMNPEIEYNKAFKLPVLLIYGAILIWCMLWLMSRLP
jgi:hypothetical protein